MRKITPSVFLAALLALGLHVVSAQAQYVQTCVSASGNDANTCHCSQPCRTFQRAHDQTLADGEITVLDPGGYGPVTITKSISIVNDGAGEASIQVSGGGIGITVNAPNGAGYVNLRGIVIQGVGFGGGTGLRFNTGFSLTMTNCVVRNHTGNGIGFFPNSSTNLSVSNTLVADNGGSGILAIPQGPGTVKIALSRVGLYNNSGDGIQLSGLDSTGTIKTLIADSVAAGNAGHGFIAASSVSSTFLPNRLMLVRSVAANNGTGIRATDPAQVWVRQSTVTGNTTGVDPAGVVISYGDNKVDANSTDGAFIGIVPKE